MISHIVISHTAGDILLTLVVPLVSRTSMHGHNDSIDNNNFLNIIMTICILNSKFIEMRS